MKRPVITIMCDYSADGLWYNGGAIDYTYLIEEMGITEERIFPFISRLSDWQHTYETFDFFSGRIAPEKIYKTKKFQDWFLDGKRIALDLRKIISNDYHVEFFNEMDNKRYTVFELVKVVEVVEVDKEKDNNGII